ncbi:SDR family oxidoreductase [Herbiconiux flava]|uniref:NAD(P)-dependent dehydrogenase (Short-subunit alcohol dehydrogenase family) n=1 Tax=Herbiconiux flava TaxID=881268 RepID=A0A852SQA3_9MICO|nr:SDR family oxidoreductase [Herbiconiux flava]NYD70986.1 NAD(P)-dependent dehydrogenase (short-subunit alcohol dehydrogenase family) [Herbiconiux flava]GLK19050.1 short-chain dehydrogenase [Herbiconiux flava]
MNIAGSVALVTGANRGIGRRFVDELLDRGAAKVYAAVRNPDNVKETEFTDARVEVLRLDLLDDTSIADAAARATDLTLLINNAGITTGANLLGANDLDGLRRELDTHLFGTLGVIRAFAPVLAANGGGAIVDIHSALSWFSTNGANGYAVAKAAEWAMTNGVRLELAAQNTLVVGIHLGAADTDMMAGYDGPMTPPREVAAAALDGVASDAIEVLVDDWSRLVKASLANDPADFYAEALRSA